MLITGCERTSQAGARRRPSCGTLRAARCSGLQQASVVSVPDSIRPFLATDANERLPFASADTLHCSAIACDISNPLRAQQVIVVSGSHFDHQLDERFRTGP